MYGFRNPETNDYTSGKVTLRTYDEEGEAITEYDHLLTATTSEPSAEDGDDAGSGSAGEAPCASWGLAPAMCLSCAPGLVLVETTCLRTCPPGYYADEGPDGPRCQGCSSGCRQCEWGPDYCTQCEDPNLFLLQDSGKCA